MAALATMVSSAVQRPVVDKTGLSGLYNVELSYTPTPDQLLGPLPPGVDPAAIDPNGPSIFTALEEQLGLKLEPQRASIDVIVIESIQRPTEN